MKITGNEPAYAKSAFYHPDGGIDPPQTGLTIRQQMTKDILCAMISSGQLELTARNANDYADIASDYTTALINQLNTTDK